MAIAMLYMTDPQPTPDLDDVRATTAIVRTDSPADTTPDNAPDAVPIVEVFPIDHNVGGGLTAAQQPAPVIASRRSLPLATQEYPDAVQAVNNGFVRQGYAVAQAERGNRGGETLQMSFGVEPIVNVSRGFGPTFFETKPVSIDPRTAIAPMAFQTPEDALANAAALNNSRKAAQPSPYGKFLEGV